MLFFNEIRHDWKREPEFGIGFGESRSLSFTTQGTRNDHEDSRICEQTRLRGVSWCCG